MEQLESFNAIGCSSAISEVKAYVEIMSE